MSLWKWSRTAASNSTADSSINWAEGQAPSTVNDSARGMMAAVAKYRDDVAGVITTGGTSTAYTVSSFQVFDTLAHMDGACIAFVPHTTNGDTVTLNVDSLGAKPLRQATGVELVSGILVEGTPYMATYSNINAEWVLKGLFGNPYNIPIGGGMIYLGTSAPNSAFVFPYGQALSRTTYAALYAQVGTSFGSGDGSTTFNILDLRGRTAIGKDNMGGSAANRVTSAGGGIDGATMGASGGAQTTTLAQANLPNVNFNVTIGSGQGSHSHDTGWGTSASFTGGAAGSEIAITQNPAGSVTTEAGLLPQLTGTAASGGSGTAISRLPPAVIVPWIIRVI
jgi:microcystin-dependent protein